MRAVITGGAGSGKSSLLKAFNTYMAYNDDYRFTLVHEPAREWISHFQKYDESKLPWNNRNFFQNLVEVLALKNWVKHDNTMGDPNNFTYIYDRGLVDELMYRDYFSMEFSESHYQNCLKYKYDKVFILPFWKEIFEKDDQRIETEEQAELQEQLLKDAYYKCGYEIIEVPKLSVKERVEFITSNLK